MNEIQEFFLKARVSGLEEDLRRLREAKPLALEELRQAYEDAGEAGLHIWIYVKELDWMVAGIVDEFVGVGLIGVYGVNDPCYTEANYGETWVAYKGV